MVACFFNKTGHVATVLLEEHRTLNSVWFNTISSEQEKTNHCSPRQCELFAAFLTAENVELMGHLPYSVAIGHPITQLFSQSIFFAKLIFSSQTTQIMVVRPDCIWQHRKYNKTKMYVAAHESSQSNNRINKTTVIDSINRILR